MPHHLSSLDITQDVSCTTHLGSLLSSSSLRDPPTAPCISKYSNILSLEKHNSYLSPGRSRLGDTMGILCLICPKQNSWFCSNSFFNLFLPCLTFYIKYWHHTSSCLDQKLCCLWFLSPLQMFPTTSTASTYGSHIHSPNSAPLLLCSPMLYFIPATKIIFLNRIQIVFFFYIQISISFPFQNKKKNKTLMWPYNLVPRHLSDQICAIK
jgi:hypothetical protein